MVFDFLLEYFFFYHFLSVFNMLQRNNVLELG